MRTRTRVTAVLLAAAAITGCGERSKEAEPGAVGTAGRSAATVTAAFDDKTPAFVGRDAEGTRLWKLTRQFYQKRGDTFAWIDDRKPRREMDELIGVLQSADREGSTPRSTTHRC